MMALVAFALGMPILLWLLIGIAGGLANATMLYLVWRLGWLDKRYRW